MSYQRLINRAGIYTNRCIISRSIHNHYYNNIGVYNMYMINKRNFKWGLGSDWTKDQRTTLEWKWQQAGKPMNFRHPLTWMGLLVPMFGFAFSIYCVITLYIEKTNEEEEQEKEIVKAITRRDPKLKIDDL